MPQPAPQPPGSARKPSQPRADAASPKPVPKSALFHTLLEGGFDAVVAYTAEKQLHAMTSEIAAAQVQPILVEMRQLFADRDQKLVDAETRMKAELKRRLAELRAELMKWMFGALLAQAALVVTLVKLLP